MELGQFSSPIYSDLKFFFDSKFYVTTFINRANFFKLFRVNLLENVHLNSLSHEEIRGATIKRLSDETLSSKYY